MPIHRPLLTTVCLVGSLALSACARDLQSGASLTAPSAVAAPTVSMAVLMVQVDAICSGQESNIRVSVDRVSIGVTNPGDPGVSEMVTVGEHQLSAISQRGTKWGPFPTAVTPGGRLERLGCMPPDQR